MYCVPTWHIIIILVSFVTCGVQNRIDCKYCQIKRFVLTFVQVYLYFTNNKNLFSERWGWKCSQLMMLRVQVCNLDIKLTNRTRFMWWTWGLDVPVLQKRIICNWVIRNLYLVWKPHDWMCNIKSLMIRMQITSLLWTKTVWRCYIST